MTTHMWIPGYIYIYIVCEYVCTHIYMYVWLSCAGSALNICTLRMTSEALNYSPHTRRGAPRQSV